MKNKIITAAYPFVPVEMNLFHMASTYLPADFYTRLAKFFNDSPLFILGVDVHGRHAKRKASQENTPLAELSDKYVVQYARQFAKMGIAPDVFIRTDDPRVLAIEKEGLENMAREGVVIERSSHDFKCSGCDERLSKSEIEIQTSTDAKTTLKSVGNQQDLSLVGKLTCSLCHSTEVSMQPTEHYVIKLVRDSFMRELFRLQPSKSVSKNLESIFNSDFSEWEFTRTGYNGFPFPLDDSKQLYLWCDSLFSKLIPLFDGKKISREQLNQTEFVSFFGKNILPYYSLIFPTILRQGFGATNPNVIFSTRGFCSGKETDTLVDIDKLLGEFSQESLRFYCGYTVPDDMRDFKINKRGLDLVKRDILERTFNRFLSESTDYVSSRKLGDAEFEPMSPEVSQLFDKLKKHYLSVSPRRILLELEQGVRGHLGKINPLSTDYKETKRLADMRKLTMDILSCYIPETVKNYSLASGLS